MDSCSVIPKLIWILWYQGIDEAPDLVRRCISSWKLHNPDWKVIFLDKNSLEEYISMRDFIDINRKDITIQKVSNLIRINLLAKYGGVWADATCFCCMPLNNWLYGYVKSGFFAFRDPGRDRILSSWFLVSSQECQLTAKICIEHNHLWRSNYFSNQGTKFGELVVKIAGPILNRKINSTRWWLSFLFTKVFRVYPYFIFHYHIADIIRKDKLSREIWERRPVFSADIPRRVNSFGICKAITAEIKDEIDNQKSPLYKLNWRVDANSSSESSVWSYLLNATGSQET